MAGSESRDEVTARIKEQADIVQIVGEHVELRRSGSRYLGLCPFHGEKTPSFSVQADPGLFYCFGCGESGDVFSFLMKFHQIDFPTALQQLAERYHIALPERRLSREEEQRRERREQLYAVNQQAAELYQRYLREAARAKPAREYLYRRGVAEPLQARFGIGYAPSVEAEGWNFLGNRLGHSAQPAARAAGLLVEKEEGGSYDRFRDRIVFPIFDNRGRVCGFGGRIVGEGQPKYLNSPESEIFVKGKMLFGLYQARDEIRRQKRAIVVEGNFDLISLVGSGLAPVVAPLGTALTRDQLGLLKRLVDKVILLFDADAAGSAAAVRAAALFFAEQLPALVALLPAGHDPDTFVREQGLPALNELLDQARDLPEFVFQHWAERHGLGLAGKGKIVEELRPLVAAAASPLQRSLCLAHFAEKLGLPVAELEQHFRLPTAGVEVSPSRPTAQRPTSNPAVPLTIAQKPLVEYMVLNPGQYQRLAEEGIRACLAGSVGEILFLHLGRLLEQNPATEPEELLSTLAEGPERALVAALLVGASSERAAGSGGGGRDLADLLAYLENCRQIEKKRQILARMERAEQQGDLSLLGQLLADLQQIRQADG